MYVIRKKGFFVDKNLKPTIEYEPVIFHSKGDAYAVIESCCEAECSMLNEGRESIDFRHQSLGDEYDEAVLFWDGDDYRVVTGYRIESLVVGQRIFHRGKNGRVFGTKIRMFAVYDDSDKIFFLVNGDEYSQSGSDLGKKWYLTEEEVQ